MTEQTKLSVLCSLFTWMQRSKSSGKKRSKFRKFLDTFCNPRDYFSAIRLVLPNLDRERGSYGLKESVLATCLIDALGMARDSHDALRLLNWRKGGAQTGANAGNFSLVAAEVLQRRQGMASGGLTINEVNDLLDRLASSENRAEKTSVLSTLINKTNAQEMKWIIMIILKDLKLGISEKSIFHEFHPDAEDLFNVTCDLKLVCEKLRDRTQRHKRQDIEVGKAVRPQLAMRVADATAAWKKLHGKEVIVECKFDGDRIQIHKNGTEIHFFSRNFLDHSEYGPGMSDIIIQNVLVDRCILDGEMLVWDTSLNRFAEFGSNQEIAKAAKDGLDGDRQLCCILSVPDSEVQKVVKPLKGRLEILVPNGGLGLNTRCPSGEPGWSLVAHNVDDVERFFKETIENRDEGIVLKDLGSKWEPSDRSGKWLKLKPEYIRAGSDLDVLIIGGYYGSGRRGGEVAQFLVGLAERPAPNTFPRRVGTGLSDEELDAVVTKLKPYFSLCRGRGKAIEVLLFDMFLKACPGGIPLSLLPLHSLTSVGGDYTLLFTLDFVNVPPTHSLDSLHKMVAENGGTFSMNLNNSVTHCVAADSKGIKYRAAKLRGDIIHYSWVLDCCSQKKLLHLQPKHFLFLSDSSKKKLEEEIDEFSDSYYQDLDLADIKQLLSNVNRSEDTKTVDYYKKKYCPKEKWSRFHGCCIYFHPPVPSLKPDWEVLLGLALRRLKLEVSIGGGKVSDSLALATHLVVLAVPGFEVDFETVLKSFSSSEKHFLRNKRLHVVKSQWLEECVERDQRLEEETYSLRTIGVEDSSTEECKHDKHDLGLGALSGLDNVENQNLSSSPDVRKQRTEETAPEMPKNLASHEGVGKRKRGRPAGTSMKRGKTTVAQARRTRARTGKKPAKITENESDESGSQDEKTCREEIKMREGNHETAGKGSSEIQETEMVEDSDSSYRGKAAEQEVEKDVIESYNNVPNIELTETHNSQDTEKPEQLEVLTDPVQAMLLDMIPSLGMKKIETIDTIREDEKPLLDPNAEPTKKKKVSYKDVASKLLKDW
uniref:DNA ligase n=1 Tax=Fagus sylvatica TaxID=28930 RepID=A0A2N9G3C4_FAGSY